MTITFLILALLLFVTLLYAGHVYWGFVSATTLSLASWFSSGFASQEMYVVAFVAAAIALVLGVPAFRRNLISGHILRLMERILPRMGDTERIALEAGTVWWDGEIFSGRPNWKKLFDFEVQPLSERERAFIEGPVETLCGMLDDWQIAQDRDLPKEVWDFLKQERFFGMSIPEEYGGLGFSAIAHSSIVAKVSSRSVAAAVTVMVPNSLGPGELILHYGTDDQKQYYLPRLAIGEEIPCFALTESEAGSDAASGKSTGVVCRGTFRGEEVIGIRLNWRKRYISLAPVATVIGLAFRLFDPDGLLGGETDLGITCALIPRDLPGIQIGERHDPMGVPFQIGPIFGEDVFVPIDFIIGGRDGAGQGWRMLMESLAAGRAISLPSLSVGAAELAVRVTGAYGTVRKQFNLSIGRFEGVEERLARIGGYTYIMNAARELTCAAVDAGEKPAVLSAIVKAYLTENMRTVMTDAMDIRAGAAIFRGPRNILGRSFVSIPIGITVEGANILTRSLIIYGQGVIRCHPFVHAEMEAVAEKNIALFDRAFFGHIGFVFQNAVRAFFLGLTGGRLIRSPVRGPMVQHVQRFTRFSAAFALVSDVVMAILGGELKRREKISGRFADVLAWMYLGSATLKKFHDEGQLDRDQTLLHWSCLHAEWMIQEALVGVLDNFPNQIVSQLLRMLIFPLGARLRPPTDALGAQIARGLLDGNEMRLGLTSEIYVPPLEEKGLGRLEAALQKIVAARPVEEKINEALRAGKLARTQRDQLLGNAVSAGIISPQERRCIEAADEIRDEVIQVDAFESEFYHALKG
ncbi:MAG: acyl-CoA dehydrogenase [Nitrospinota bacterium]